MNKILYLFIKRIFDIIISILGCLLLIPITIFIKIKYFISKDYESIFYVQSRIGKNGKIFKLYKFRTMVVNADSLLNQLLEDNKEMAYEFKINKKIKNDPRITKAGKFIRRYSIDEVPQFINILKGDMSFVGNRPYLVEEKKDMGNYYYDIVKSKPGLTGIWQTASKKDISFKKRLKLEKYYSNKCNLILDFKIIIKTFKVVIYGKQ